VDNGGGMVQSSKHRQVVLEAWALVVVAVVVVIMVGLLVVVMWVDVVVVVVEREEVGVEVVECDVLVEEDVGRDVEVEVVVVVVEWLVLVLVEEDVGREVEAEVVDVGVPEWLVVEVVELVGLTGVVVLRELLVEVRVVEVWVEVDVELGSDVVVDAEVGVLDERLVVVVPLGWEDVLVVLEVDPVELWVVPLADVERVVVTVVEVGVDEWVELELPLLEVVELVGERVVDELAVVEWEVPVVLDWVVEWDMVDELECVVVVLLRVVGEAVVDVPVWLVKVLGGVEVVPERVVEVLEGVEVVPEWVVEVLEWVVVVPVWLVEVLVEVEVVPEWVVEVLEWVVVVPVWLVEVPVEVEVVPEWVVEVPVWLFEVVLERVVDWVPVDVWVVVLVGVTGVLERVVVGVEVLEFDVWLVDVVPLLVLLVWLELEWLLVADDVVPLRVVDDWVLVVLEWEVDEDPVWLVVVVVCVVGEADIVVLWVVDRTVEVVLVPLQMIWL
jgi:hypothetical protein